MLQYQAWWAVNDYRIQIESMEWLSRFRDGMQPWTEGGFINFPDRDLVQFTNDDPRKELLRFYYAGNLDTLIGIKAQYDPGNFFDFEMGIPTS
jgi:hypothetical protein